MEDKPLPGDSGTKRPVILYIIIGVLVIVIIVLSIVLGTKKTDCDCPAAEPISSDPVAPLPPETPSPYNPSHFINVKDGYGAGAKALQGQLNHFDSPYFKMVDIYNMESNENRTILSKFKTYQQTSEHSADCAAIIMILDYYGYKDLSEKQCMLDFGFSDVDRDFTDEDYNNINLTAIGHYFKKFGFDTTSNLNYTSENFPFNDTLSFSNYTREMLKKNETMLVIWGDWGGVTSVVIGVDTMGNPDRAEDQVLILADTYDTCDHLNDGYYIIGLDKFYYNWALNRLSYIPEDSWPFFVVVHRNQGN